MCKEFEKRAEPLQLDGDLKPDMIQALANEMMVRGIVPELGAFDAGMINYAKYLEKKGLLYALHYANLLLGNIACAQADLLHTGMMVRDLPDNTFWSLAGIDTSQLMMNSIAIASGGGVRVGLEDNIWYDLGRTQLATNESLLRRVHHLAEANERKVMSPEKLRKALNLQGSYGKYGRDVR